MNASNSSTIEQLRRQIAGQRRELSGQLRRLLDTAATPRGGHRWGSIGVIAAAAVFLGLAARRRSRNLLRSTVTTGWLIWRATRLIRNVMAAFSPAAPPK
ncbi:MAG: hypothetical protein ACKO8O_17920 [Betaproteobacteria bacterium]